MEKSVEMSDLFGNSTLFPSPVKENNFSVVIEEMTPQEIESGGKSLSVNYEFAASSFGLYLVAATEKGVCFLAFGKDEEMLKNQLFRYFPKAEFTQRQSPFFDEINRIFEQSSKKPIQIKLHLKATPFQLVVWNELLKIPAGKLSTYGEIARRIGSPGASRAVGTAVGQNPVAYLIPCHRVVRTDGGMGGYRWGVDIKKEIIARETSA